MKVFLTGATGFIGKNLLERLNKEEVYCFRRGDSIIRKVKKFKPDVIIHCAGEIYKDNEMFLSNVMLTYDLLIASLKIPYTSFIYVGSSSEYGRKKKPMVETDYLNPTNMYEATKACGTFLCQAVARMCVKPISIVRPFSVYGKYEPSHRFIPTIIRKLKNDEILKLAPGTHDFIHVDDFVSGIIALIDKPQRGEIFNFGTGIQYTNFEVVEKVEKLANKKIKKEYVGQMRPFDTDIWVANIDKARNILDWKVTKTLSEGLSELI